MSQILWLWHLWWCWCLLALTQIQMEDWYFNIIFFFCLCPWMEHEWNRKISLLCCLSHSVEMMLHMSFFFFIPDVGKNGNIRFSSKHFCVTAQTYLGTHMYNYNAQLLLFYILFINSSFLNIPFIRKVYLFRNPLI